jgi:S-adenosylmethionine:tRNA ribosyltransferase-isomerase
LNNALEAGKRIVTVGTTSTRLLEYLMTQDGKIQPGCGVCDLFIFPGYQFKIVQAIITNFHLPKSTLIMLVSAFAGRELILNVYLEAIEKRYRFYSYGDVMFIF